MDVKTAKKLLRERIWTKLEIRGVAVSVLRVPNFACSERSYKAFNEDLFIA